MTEKVLEEYNKQKEDAVKQFWIEKKIYQKAKKAGAKNKRTFYFMDGPPYATGYIHMGTALNKILKDVSIRSKRMQACDVFDRAGYDTHGVPIESKVEQKLGFRTKQDIENFGVKNFVEECRKFATQFIGIQNQEFFDLGAWLDYDDPYLTLSDDYINATWWTFKKADEKGLLYLGKYPVHVCAHCETAVSFNEIEYTKQTDTSVYVKFKVKGTNNKYLIIWTTTPWTLPGNTGVMVHPEFDYAEARLSNGEIWIVAKDRLQQLMTVLEAAFTIEREFKGKELEGMQYENPLSPNLSIPKEELQNGYRVILSERYVNLEDGTGLVHTAPGHGKEDFDAGSKAKLPIISPIGMNGLLTKEAGKYAEKKARVVDEEIMNDLQESGALVYKHAYSHDYPICWRCKQPLLMMSVPQWFIKVSAIQPRLLELNETVNWVPDWMKARMKNWIDSLSDWPVSRARYWGTALPIWVCEKCSARKVIGSAAELEKLSGQKVKELHKPEIDEITLPCDCGETMKRTPEVLDVWFDAGASSWAALQYPATEKLFKKFWPADLNIEATEQVRGWWNAQLIQSVICFDEKPFKAIAVHGMVLDMGKKKMSKSQGNIVSPKDIIAKYNRDYLRYYLIQNSRGSDLAFDESAFKDIHKFFNTLWNSINYANMYLQLDLQKAQKPKTAKLQVEDAWLLSKTNSLTEAVLKAYNDYEFFKALAAIEYFVMEELSRTYIKLIRSRIGTKTEKNVASTLSIAIDSLLKLLAPITPHITEYFFQHLRSARMPESIHLMQLPAPNKKRIDAELEKEMEKAKALSQAILALREEQKKKLRWTLKELVLVTKTGKEFKKVLPIIKTTANVKKASEATRKPKATGFAEKEFDGTTICLNVEADAALKNEWEFQELRRRVQEKRKEAKLRPEQKAILLIDCNDAKFLRKFKKQIESETNTRIQQAKGKMEKLLDREFYIELKVAKSNAI